jgi:hypothetical protein
MQQPKIDVQQLKLSQLLGEMTKGSLQVPRFQREFVWPITKTRELLDSMYKEFPIGTFFLWKAPQGSPQLIRPLTELGIKLPDPGTQVSYILDGQQRLTSLYAVVHGVRIGSRNYGRICIDLDTASRYADVSDEGFEEDIFTYQTPDNQRYVSVQDLISDQHMTLFTSIPQQWQTAFIRAYQMFQGYPFSVVWIQEQTLADAIDIFQRINQAGKRLSRYDLVCANVWAEDFDFRKRVAIQNEKFANAKFGALHETIYTQTFALVLKDNCTTAGELGLDTDGIRSVWNKAIQALELAVNFAYSNLGVKRSDFLPYRGILPVLAYFFYHAPSPALTAAQRDMLWEWFWRVSLSERYSSTSPSRMAEDAQKLRGSFKGVPALFNYPSKVTVESVLRTKMTSTTSALRNAVLCMLALHLPLNFKDGSPINLADDFFSDLKKAERHHVFPVAYLKSQGRSGEVVHMVPNFCFIPSDLNKEISDKAPSKYLTQYRNDNPKFAAAAESHMLPVATNAAIWNDDFEAFLHERASLLADELNRFAGSTPEALTIKPNAEDVVEVNNVSTTEIRIRDLIDSRLSAAVGQYYWKQTMPGDVITYVKEKIADYMTKNPQVDQMQLQSGRRRLDFCDVSHYEKIINKNWALFGPVFADQQATQQHLVSYRVLRNAVAHNREPSVIEQKLGDAAIIWLNAVMDKYEIEQAALIAAQNGDGEDEQIAEYVQ